MELQKFETAKKVKENLDRLEVQKRKLEEAFKSCSLGVTIGYSYGGTFPRKGEVCLYNTEAIKEMISRELRSLEEQIDLVKEEFVKL